VRQNIAQSVSLQSYIMFLCHVYTLARPKDSILHAWLRRDLVDFPTSERSSDQPAPKGKISSTNNIKCREGFVHPTERPSVCATIEQSVTP
jgi:hypothetical protein